MSRSLVFITMLSMARHWQPYPPYVLVSTTLHTALVASQQHGTVELSQQHGTFEVSQQHGAIELSQQHSTTEAVFSTTRHFTIAAVFSRRHGTTLQQLYPVNDTALAVASCGRHGGRVRILSTKRGAVR